MTDTGFLSTALLAWYGKEGRVLPWRIDVTNAYKVWLAEIMLQQTTVVTVIPYYEKFLAAFPTVHDLAAASLDQVFHLWQGLGYYARARNLHRCAQIVSTDHKGAFPPTYAGLLTLPGIGSYTAAAVASIAFNKAAPVVDGNVIRVLSRFYCVETPLPQAKAIITDYAACLTPAHNPGDYAQAIMDLGATLCTARNPQCVRCPWKGGCGAFAAGSQADFPVKKPKPPVPQKEGVFFILQHPVTGALWIRKRPPTGLLGGLMEIPSSTWQIPASGSDAAKTETAGEARPGPFTDAPNPLLTWRPFADILPVVHVFTHFKLTLTFVGAVGFPAPGSPGEWMPWDDMTRHSWPTLMKKALKKLQASSGI